MHEIYNRAAVLYKEMLEDSQSSVDEKLCSCANDIVDNGVASHLVTVAKTLKYRARQGRNAKKDEEKYVCERYISERYISEKYRCRRRKRSTDEDIDIATLEQEYLDNTDMETAGALLAAGGWTPSTTTGPKEWITFSAMLYRSLPTEEMIKDFATFLYCKLNNPDALPQDLF